MKKNEQKMIEGYLQAISKQISPKQFDYLGGQFAARGSFYEKYTKKIEQSSCEGLGFEGLI